jgi:hypothetical protein
MCIPVTENLDIPLLNTDVCNALGERCESEESVREKPIRCDQIIRHTGRTRDGWLRLPFTDMSEFNMSQIQHAPPAIDGLYICPTQWSNLPELHDSLPLDDTDLACLADLKTVLARHGKLDRFAVQLAHRHFELAHDEILIEQPDPQARTQHVSVAPRGDHPAVIPTTWLFDDHPALRLVDETYCVCVKANGVDCGGHGKSPVPPEPVRRERQQKEIGNPAERQAEIERIDRDESRYRTGFPVAGHGQRQRDNDPGRSR